jgi:2-polyprenyl-3-methyl-5-hydroxy-6-metoxy-1,4-benzoquinol methylase
MICIMATFMTNWQPSTTYKKIAEANRKFYGNTARQYDGTETCITDPRTQAELEATLDRVLAVLGKRHSEILALDACGGSGNISLKLLRRNIKVVLTDISPELQNIFSAKCKQLNLSPETVCSEIADFLSHTKLNFDLIVFSSALHHLENIDDVLTLAFGRLNPNGLLFTVFDPTSREQISTPSRILLRMEYLIFKVFCQTADLPKAVGRRLSRIFSGSSSDNKSNVNINDATAGMLAEYHIEKGIDDAALVSRMQQVGYEIVWHERFAGARFKWTTRMINRLGDVNSFKLLLRKPRGVVQEGTESEGASVPDAVASAEKPI